VERVVRDNAPRDRAKAEVGACVKIQGRPGVHLVVAVNPATAGVRLGCRPRYYAAVTARVVTEAVACSKCEACTT